MTAPDASAKRAWRAKEKRLAAAVDGLFVKLGLYSPAWRDAFNGYQRHLRAGVAAGLIDEAAADAKRHDRADVMLAFGLAALALDRERDPRLQASADKELGGLLASRCADFVSAIPKLAFVPEDRWPRIAALARQYLERL